jgi:hypothetical protein
VFRMNVANVDPDVALVIYVCCKSLFKIFHLFQTSIASVLSGCCICCNGYIVSVCSKSFICF